MEVQFGILPKQNEKHVIEDLSEELRRDLTLHFVSTIAEVLELALQPAAARPTSDVADPAAQVHGTVQ